MSKLSPSEVLRTQNHGRYIYAYCHINTNQVVYSLTQTLHNHSTLKQLPDLGANNKPTALRKDLWRPFFTVILPNSAAGKAQGLHAYKKLLEWRTLHETSWRPSPLLSRPYSHDEIDEIKKRLEDRGGSKTETAYDIIKREKKKMRIREVRDQKANSVADLATVLIDQEIMGSKLMEEQEQENEERKQENEKRRQEKVNEILVLYSAAERGSLQKLGKSIDSRAQYLEQLKQAGELARHEVIRKDEWQRQRQATMQVAVDTVSRIRTELQQGTDLQSQPEAQATNDSQDTSMDNTVPTKLSEEERLYVEKRLKELQPSIPIPVLHSRTPKRGALRQRIRRASRPRFTTKGVQVTWQNPLDAEFASEWPEDVEHFAMGFARHTAPKAELEPVLDIEGFKQRDRAGRRHSRQVRSAGEARVWREGGIKTPELDHVFKRRTGPLQTALMKVANEAFVKQRQEKRRQARDELAQPESA